MSNNRKKKVDQFFEADNKNDLIKIMIFMLIVDFQDQQIFYNKSNT